MANITTFPTLHNVLVEGDNVHTYKAGGTIKAGQVVAFEGAGVSKQVVAAVKGTTKIPRGVALYPAAAGEYVAVAEEGCWVRVVNSDDTLAIDAGDPIEDHANAVGGTVATAPTTPSGTVAVLHRCVGFAVEDIAGGGTGLIEVAPGTVTQPNLT